MASQTCNNFSGAATNGASFNADRERTLSEALNSYINGAADSSTLGGNSLFEDPEYHEMVQMRRRSQNTVASSTSSDTQTAETAAKNALADMQAPSGNTLPSSTIDPALLALDEVDFRYPEDCEKLVFEPDTITSGNSLEFDSGLETHEAGPDQSLDFQGQQWRIDTGAVDNSFQFDLDPNQEFDLNGPTIDLDALSVYKSATVDHTPARSQAGYNPALPLGAMQQDLGVDAPGISTQFNQVPAIPQPFYEQNFDGAQQWAVRGVYGSSINGYLDPRMGPQVYAQAPLSGAQQPAAMGTVVSSTTVYQHSGTVQGQFYAPLNGAQQPVSQGAAGTTSNPAQDLGAPVQIPPGLGPEMTQAFHQLVTAGRTARSQQSTGRKRTREQVQDEVDDGNSSATTPAAENSERPVKRNKHGTPLINPNKAANRQGQCPGWAQAKKQHIRRCKENECKEDCTLREMFPLSWTKFKEQKFRVKYRHNGEVADVSGLEIWRLGTQISVQGELDAKGKLDPSSKECHRVDYVAAVDGPRNEESSAEGS